MPKEKSILELLILVKNLYNEGILYHNTGLCLISFDLRKDGIITIEEEEFFDKYLIDSNRDNKVFYDMGKEVKEYNGSCHIWKKDDVEGRNNWLNKHIKLN